MNTTTSYERISITPGVMGGKPCIAGHRIRVMDIYIWHELDGQSADEIVADFPQLSHADVYSALAYFWENREAVLKDIERQDELVAKLQVGHVSKVAEKLKAMNVGKISP